MFARPSLRWLVSPAPSLASRTGALKTTTRRACLHQSSTGTQFRATPAEIPPQTRPAFSSSAETSSTPHNLSRSRQQREAPQDAESSSSSTSAEGPTIPLSKTPSPPTFTSPLRLSPKLTSLLPHLCSQPSHYITAHLHARPYLLTVGDTLRLPFAMPDVHAGDIIRLNRASALGSRDFTLRGAPYVDERLFECRLRVMGTEFEPLRVKEKTKRRQRHVQRVKSQHRYTILRVMDVRVKPLEELLEEGAEIVKEEQTATDS